jgi:hypothetical protein
LEEGYLKIGKRSFNQAIMVFEMQEEMVPERVL